MRLLDEVVDLFTDADHNRFHLQLRRFSRQCNQNTQAIAIDVLNFTQISPNGGEKGISLPLCMVLSQVNFYNKLKK